MEFRLPTIFSSPDPSRLWRQDMGSLDAPALSSASTPIMCEAGQTPGIMLDTPLVFNPGPSPLRVKPLDVLQLIPTAPCGYSTPFNFNLPPAFPLCDDLEGLDEISFWQDPWRPQSSLHLTPPKQNNPAPAPNVAENTVLGLYLSDLSEDATAPKPRLKPGRPPKRKNGIAKSPVKRGKNLAKKFRAKPEAAALTTAPPKAERTTRHSDLVLSASPQTNSRSRAVPGCWTCKVRRKLCDRGKPGCQVCAHLGLECDGYSPTKPIYMSDPAANRARRELLAERVRLYREKEGLILPFNKSKK